jgi:hypothetical protein
MTRIALLVLAGIVLIASIVAGRSYVIASAHQELRNRNFFTYEILGTRVPCSDTFDLGVSVIYQVTPTGTKYQGAKLCRNLYGPWVLRDE